MKAFRDSAAGDPFEPATPDGLSEAEDAKTRKLEAARRAVDRRLKDERRKKRRSRRMRRRIKWIVTGLILLNGVAFLGLETPSDPLSIWTYIGFDKFEHLFTFMALTAVMIPVLSRWVSPALTMVLVTLFGLVTEIAQAYSPGRTPDFGDFVADQVGILIGWWVGRLILDKLRARANEGDNGLDPEPRPQSRRRR